MSFKISMPGRPVFRFGISSVSLLLLFVFIVISACEKDDICVDGDTPLLIIRFYDAADSVTLKSVASLRILGIGNGEPLNTFTDRSSRDSVAVPLRINEANTQFQIILNSDGEDNTETGNIDTLQFNYETNEVFVSRAVNCGQLRTGLKFVDLDTDNLDTGNRNYQCCCNLTSQRPC